MFNLTPGIFSSRSVFHTEVKDGNNKSKLLRCIFHQYDPAPENFSSELEVVFVSLVMTVEWRGLRESTKYDIEQVFDHVCKEKPRHFIEKQLDKGCLENIDGGLLEHHMYHCIPHFEAS